MLVLLALLFFFTGIAIVLYLNQKPLEPRERDYAYVGSFYAFAIWIGFGVLAIKEWVFKKLTPATGAYWCNCDRFVCCSSNHGCPGLG